MSSYGVYLKGVPIEAVPEMNEADLRSDAFDRQRRLFDEARGPVTPLLSAPAGRRDGSQPHPALRKHLIDSLAWVTASEDNVGPMQMDESQEMLVAELDIALAHLLANLYKDSGGGGPQAQPEWLPSMASSWKPGAVALLPRPTPSWYGDVLAGRLGISSPASSAPEGGPTVPASEAEPFSYVRDTSKAIKGLDPKEIINYGPVSDSPTIKQLIDAGEDIGPVYEDLLPPDPSQRKSATDDRPVTELVGRLFSGHGEATEWTVERLERDMVERFAQGVALSDPEPGGNAVSVLSVETAQNFLLNNDVMVRYDWKRLSR